MTGPHPAQPKRATNVIRPWASPLFWIVQFLMIGTAAAWTVHRDELRDELRSLPSASLAPLRIEPLYDRPEVVSDEDLQSVLHKLRPQLRGPQPKINHVDHALRFWGVESEFTDPECLSGIEMRELLLDHRRFRDAWGSDTSPFLIPDTRGTSIRTMEGAASASHVDHTLAGLAEVGTPLDYPVLTPSGEVPLQTVLDQSLSEFSLNQAEYEWSTLAYALYQVAQYPRATDSESTLPRWFTTEGQEITFDRLAERIMRQRLAQGVCRGNHRLHALVMLLRVNEQHRILTNDGRQRIVDYLLDVTRRLVETQHTDGWWDRSWPGSESDGEPETGPSEFVPEADRILVTGHVLEWWALSPTEILPPPQVVTAAGQWLTHEIQGLSDSQVKSQYTFLTHAGRALALWRGSFPADVYRKP